MKRARRTQPFDRRDGAALVLNRESKAAVDPLAIDQNRARAAGALVATLLRPREPQMIAHKIEERGPGIDVCVELAAIDAEVHTTSVKLVRGIAKPWIDDENRRQRFPNVRGSFSRCCLVCSNDRRQPKRPLCALGVRVAL